MSLRDKLRILMVDDMSTSRGLIVQALESFGLAGIHLAANGSEALASSPVHLMISDYNMPGMDGLELLRRLRGQPQTRNLGFVLLTGRADKNLIESGQALA